jgi:phage tail protein X
LWAAAELAADEASLLVADGPHALAECLVQFGARLLERPVAGQIPVTGFRSHLGRRVQRLLCLEGETWSPPRRLPAALARSFGAAALAAAVVLCTAWVTPRELAKGDTMRNIQQNWKQSLAAIAFLAGINGHDAVARQAQTQAPAPAAPSSATAPAAPTGSAPLTSHRRNGLATSATAPASPASAAASASATSARLSASAERVQAKLKAIVLEEVGPMDNLPLSEVAKMLNDWARKKDPEGTGVNLLMDFKTPSEPALGMQALDPATGLPVAAPVETVDLNAIGIKIPFPLHNITLKDMLDVLLKASDRPIKYTIEDYGVLFSLAPRGNAAEAKPVPATEGTEGLTVRTFKVKADLALWNGMGETFGVVAAGRPIQAALEEVFHKLGATPRPNSVFYNQRTEVLMVRASREEMEVIRAAMETLTGLEPRPDPRIQRETQGRTQGEVGMPGAQSGSSQSEATDPWGHAALDINNKYRVQSGDTLSTIVAAFNQKHIMVTEREILNANPGLRPERLRVGMDIYVPIPKRASGKVYLDGAVRQAGPQEIPDGEVLTVCKAILQAGGFSDFADKRKVRLIRHETSEQGARTTLINVGDILEKGQTEKDVPVQAGDIVVVPVKSVSF